MKRVVFHPEAEVEFLAAAGFYEAQRRGLGVEFIAEVAVRLALSSSIRSSDIGQEGFGGSLSSASRMVCSTASTRRTSPSWPSPTSVGGLGTGVGGVDGGLPNTPLERTGDEVPRWVPQRRGLAGRSAADRYLARKRMTT